jgi:hypothetical protein
MRIDTKKATAEFLYIPATTLPQPGHFSPSLVVTGIPEQQQYNLSWQATTQHDPMPRFLAIWNIGHAESSRPSYVKPSPFSTPMAAMEVLLAGSP